MSEVMLDTWVQHDCTLGRLSVGDFHCFTLELPWCDNKTNVSCIPEGTYRLLKHESPANGSCLLIEGVDGRSHIQIHSGNYTSQIKGCVLVGDSIKYLNSDYIPDVTNSRSTLKQLIRAVDVDAEITIRRVHS